MSKRSKHNLRDLKADKALDSISIQLIDNGGNTSKKKDKPKSYICRKNPVLNITSDVSKQKEKNCKIGRANPPLCALIDPRTAHGPSNKTRKLQNSRCPENKSALYQSAQVYKVSLSNPDVRAGNGELLLNEDSKENWMTFPDIKWRNAMSDESLFVALTEDGRSFCGYSSSEDFLLDTGPVCSSYTRLRETGGIALQTNFIASGVSIIDKSMRKMKKYGKRLAKLRIKEIRPTFSAVSLALPEVLSFEQQTEPNSGALKNRFIQLGSDQDESNNSSESHKTSHHHRHDHHHFHHHPHKGRVNKSDTLTSVDDDDENDDTSSANLTSSSEDRRKFYCKQHELNRRNRQLKYNRNSSSNIKRKDLKDTHEDRHQHKREDEKTESKDVLPKKGEAIKQNNESSIRLVVSDEIQTEPPKCTHHFHRRRRHIDPRYEDFLRHYYQHHDLKYRCTGMRHHRNPEFHYNVAQMKIAEGMQTHKSHLRQQMLYEHHKHHQRHHVRHHRPKPSPKVYEDPYQVHRTHHHHAKHKHKHHKPKPISTKSAEEKKNSVVQFKKELVEEKPIPNTVSVVHDVPKGSIEKIKKLVKKWKHKSNKTADKKANQAKNTDEKKDSEKKDNEKKDDEKKDDEKKDNEKKETEGDLKNKIPKKSTGNLESNEIPRNIERRNSDDEIIEEKKERRMSGDETFEEKKEGQNSSDEVSEERKDRRTSSDESIEEKKEKLSTAYEQIQQTYPRFPGLRIGIVRRSKETYLSEYEEVGVPLSEVKIPVSETSSTSLRDSIKALLKHQIGTRIHKPSAIPRHISRMEWKMTGNNRSGVKTVLKLWSVTQYQPHLWSRYENAQPRDISSSYENCYFYPSDQFVNPSVDDLYKPVDEGIQIDQSQFIRRITKFDFLKYPKRCTKYIQQRPTLNEELLAVEDLNQTREASVQSPQLHRSFCRSRAVSTQSHIPPPLTNVTSTQSTLINHTQRKSKFGECHMKPRRNFDESSKRILGVGNLKEVSGNISLSDKPFLIKNSWQQKERYPNYFLKQQKPAFNCIRPDVYESNPLEDGIPLNILIGKYNANLDVESIEQFEVVCLCKQKHCVCNKKVNKDQKFDKNSVNVDIKSKNYALQPKRYHDMKDLEHMKLMNKGTTFSNEKLVNSDSSNFLRPSDNREVGCCKVQSKEMIFLKKAQNREKCPSPFLDTRIRPRQKIVSQQPCFPKTLTTRDVSREQETKICINPRKYNTNNKNSARNYSSLQKQSKSINTELLHADSFRCIGQKYVYKPNSDCGLSKRCIEIQTADNYCWCRQKRKELCVAKTCRKLPARSCDCLPKRNWATENMYIGKPKQLFKAFEKTIKYTGCYDNENNEKCLQVTESICAYYPLSCECIPKRRNVNKNKKKEKKKKGVHPQSPPIRYRPQFRSLCLCNHSPETRCKDRLCNQQNISKNNVSTTIAMVDCASAIYTNEELGQKFKNNLQVTKPTIVECPSANKYSEELKKLCLCKNLQKPIFLKPKSHNCFWEQQQNVYKNNIDITKKKHVADKYPIAIINTAEDRNNGFYGQSLETKKCRTKPKERNTFKTQNHENVALRYIKNVSEYKLNTWRKASTINTLCKQNPVTDFTRNGNQVVNSSSDHFRQKNTTNRHNSNDKIIDDEKVIAYHNFEQFTDSPSRLNNKKSTNIGSCTMSLESSNISTLSKADHFYRTVSDICNNFKWLKRASKCVPFSIKIPKLSQSKRMIKLLCSKKHPPTYCKELPTLTSSKQPEYKISQEFDYNKNINLPYSEYKHSRKLQEVNTDQNHFENENVIREHDTMLPPNIKFERLRSPSVADFLSHQHLPIFNGPLNSYTDQYEYDQFFENYEQPTYITPGKYKLAFRDDEYDFSVDSDDSNNCYDNCVKKFKRFNCAQTQSEQGPRLQITKKVSCQCPVVWRPNGNALYEQPPGIKDILKSMNAHEHTPKKIKLQRNLTKCPGTCKFDTFKTQPKESVSPKELHVYLKDGLEFQTSVRDNMTKIASKLSNCLKGNPRSKVLVLKRHDSEHNLPAYVELDQLKNMRFKKLSFGNLHHCHYKMKSGYPIDNCRECFCRQKIPLYQPVVNTHTFARQSNTPNDQVYYFKQWYDIQHQKSNMLLCPDYGDMAHQSQQVIKSGLSPCIKMKLINELNTDRELEESPENMGSLSLLNSSAVLNKPQPVSENQPVNENLHSYQLQRFDQHKDTINKHNCDHGKNNHLDLHNIQRVQYPKNEIKFGSETQTNMQRLEEQKFQKEITDYTPCSCNKNKVQTIEALDTYRELKQIIKLKGNNCPQKILALENIFLRPQSTNKNKHFNEIESRHSRLQLQEDDKCNNLMQSSNSIQCLEELEKRNKVTRKENSSYDLKCYHKSPNRYNSSLNEQLGPNCTCAKPNIGNDVYTQLQKLNFKQQLNLCENPQPTISYKYRKIANSPYKNVAIQQPAIRLECKDVTTSACNHGVDMCIQYSYKNMSTFTNTSIEPLCKSTKKVNCTSQYKAQDLYLMPEKENYSSTVKFNDCCNQIPEQTFTSIENNFGQPFSDETSYYIPNHGTVHKNHKCMQTRNIYPVVSHKNIAISTSFCNQECAKCPKYYSEEESYSTIKIQSRYPLKQPKPAIHRKTIVVYPTVSSESSVVGNISCKQVPSRYGRPKYYLEKGCPGKTPPVHKKDKRLQTRYVCPIVSREYCDKERSLCKYESRRCITSKYNSEKGSVNVIKRQDRSPMQQPICVVNKKNIPIQTISSTVSHRNCSIQNTLCKPQIHRYVNPKYISDKVSVEHMKSQNWSPTDFIYPKTGINLNNKRSKQNRFYRRKPSLVLTCPEDNLENLHDNDCQPLRLSCKMKRLSKPEVPMGYCRCGRGNRKRRNKSKKSYCECSTPKRKRFQFMHRKKSSKVRAAEKEIEEMLKNRPSQNSCSCNNEPMFNGRDSVHRQCQKQKKKLLTQKEDLDVISLRKRHPSLFLICPK